MLYLSFCWLSNSLENKEQGPSYNWVCAEVHLSRLLIGIAGIEQSSGETELVVQCHVWKMLWQGYSSSDSRRVMVVLGCGLTMRKNTNL